jgi:DNA-binding MarR family transcriptional regulator/N-acetylglutamate synthase-like GNAT family acetyltransferase
MATVTEARIDSVRRFNRFYTKQIGVLQEGLLQSPFSLAEARVLYELAQRERPTATVLAAELGLDPGYLSRILRRLEKKALVGKSRSEEDGRESFLALTAEGREAFSRLDTGSANAVRALLSGCSVPDQRRLVDAMDAIENVLGAASPPRQIALRPHRPGDIGWVIHRHGALYAQEHGYDASFEALVAEIAADFLRKFDRARERCWIAECDGEIVGSVFLVRKSDRVAKLRLLLVEPRARGMGVGRRLVAECIRFARQAGYRRITLWTQRGLDSARRIYEHAGFRLASEQPHHSFGRDLVAQTWDMNLQMSDGGIE